ncbi:unnamed protein product [Protopolystoma xenopodis]|uniref:Uncharacterized protein n=1 Tax=Protopolystoma xenopodis TaxID=117903 RepID=A0A448WM48_9PLAT|nr:unnamed protein product [Protopolystoma xenopodis]
MCTKISGEKAITALLEVLELEGDILEAEWIRQESLRRLINLTISTTHFSFCGNIYEQISGLPMGYSLTSFDKCIHGQIGEGIREVTASTKSANAIPGRLLCTLVAW